MFCMYHTVDVTTIHFVYMHACVYMHRYVHTSAHALKVHMYTFVFEICTIITVNVCMRVCM